MKSLRTILVFCLLLVALPVFASTEGLAEGQTALVIQIGIVLFAAKLGGIVAQRLGMPTVLGELLAGIVIGPYALGALAVPGFPHGLFYATISEIPVSPELYGIATIASIILLFVSGLETDLSLFLKYSVAGGIVGLGGVVVAFTAGDLVGVAMFGGSFMDPRNLFLGILSTATSVGITARILSDKKRMDSPEGVTILAAAVFDDVLGIVFLAVVMGIAAASGGSGGSGGDIAWGRIGVIAARAFGIWLGVTALGLVFAKSVAKFLKRFKHASAFSILALGIALIMSGFFEREGLAMIIGAYITGLSLSKTDISHIIIEKVHVLYEFFVPVFFAVMGMLVDVRQMASPTVIAAGLVFTVVGVLSKVLGCGLPAMFVGFNVRGALRIGAGMVPRGEVALIIAGIGATSGILDAKLFGVAIMMTLLTTLVAPFGLSATLRLPGSGTRKPDARGESRSVDFDFPSEDVAVLVTDTMTHELQAEGYYVRTMDIEEGIAQVRRDDKAFSMRLDGSRLTIQAAENALPIVQTSVFEAVAALNASFSKLKSDFDPASIQKASQAEGSPRAAPLGAAEVRAVCPSCVILDLKADTKEGVIRELLGVLEKNGRIDDAGLALADVMERERSMSTGMQNGVALPHAKTDAVRVMAAAIGLKRGGVEFQSLDGKPATIVVLLATPKKNPGAHIQFLAGIGAALRDEGRRAQILAASSADDVIRLIGV
jgi:Kef-type K+ transport system membrane component KefB/mannitol/fructose-specific phosphotransferase system IIA component (Ntr-type)